MSVTDPLILQSVQNPRTIRWLNSHVKPLKIKLKICGRKGYVFNVGNRILKITRDEVEAVASLHSMHNFSPYLTEIYDVRKMKIKDEFNYERTLFFILQEKINTRISKDLKEAADKVGDFLIRNTSSNLKVNEKVMKEILEERFEDDVLRNWSFELLRAVKETLHTTGIYLKDLFAGNVGMRKKQITFFDFGESLYFSNGQLMSWELQEISSL